MSNAATTTTKSNPLDNAVNLGEFIEARFALFNNTPEDRDDDKVHPVMRGVLETTAFKLDVGAFLETAKNGAEYLSLAIGGADQEKLYGRFFRDPKEGKEGHYYGYIERSVETGVDDEGQKIYEKLWTLGIDAGRRESDKGVKYIGGKVFLKGAGKPVVAAALNF
jgi:hypothetical protein